jgi:glycosyltransferase involved in cell wall biosynthesis
MKPFFSIAIPTYGYNGKGGEFLKFSLDRINKQSFKDFEVVISDHSTDDTILEITKLWENRLNLKYIRNDKGRGIISPNINVAMEKCEGEWIKVLFQDDFLFDEYSLDKQMEFINSNKELIWFFSNFYHSNTGYDFYRFYEPLWNDYVWSGNNTLGCPSGLTLKNNDILYFDESLNWLMDCDYYERMKNKFGLPKYLREVTVVNRTWGARLTDTITEELKSIELKIVSKKHDKTT